jgi:UDP:flavonoid glycosyltransferase YjiC (YdhE family)
MTTAQPGRYRHYKGKEQNVLGVALHSETQEELVVHHGGIGTTGLAMWSGRPMLVMPCASDQPDHAERVRRLGIARTVPRNRDTPGRLAAELRELLDNPVYSRRASQVGEQVRNEDGVRAACDALQGLLQPA